MAAKKFINTKSLISFIVITCIGLLTWLLAWGHTEITDVPKFYSTKKECKVNQDKIETTVIREIETLRNTVKDSFQQQQVYISDGFAMIRNDLRAMKE